MIREIHLNRPYIFDPVDQGIQWANPPGSIIVFNRQSHPGYFYSVCGGWSLEFILRNFREHDIYLIEKILERYGTSD